jgi:hypothetical protein
VDSKSHLVSDESARVLWRIAIWFKMQIYRGKMPLPLVVFDVDRQLYDFITSVGVGSSHEVYAPLLNQIDAYINLFRLDM